MLVWPNLWCCVQKEAVLMWPNPWCCVQKEPVEEEVDIDLTDPEVNKAAIKIQATFRGHQTRKNH